MEGRNKEKQDRKEKMGLVEVKRNRLSLAQRCKLHYAFMRPNVSRHNKVVDLHALAIDHV